VKQEGKTVSVVRENSMRLLMISANGIITGFSLTPANVDERDALWDLVPQIQGLLIVRFV